MTCCCFEFVGQNCGFTEVDQLSTYGSQYEDWLVHPEIGLIKAFCINNADDFSIVESQSWSTTLDEDDWSCGFSWTGLRADTILVVGSGGYNQTRAAKINALSGSVLSESTVSWAGSNGLVRDHLTDECIYMHSSNSIRCWSPWTEQTSWVLDEAEFPFNFSSSPINMGLFRATLEKDYFTLWPNGQQPFLHCRDAASGALISAPINIGSSLFNSVRMPDNTIGILAFNPNSGEVELFDESLDTISNGQTTVFSSESQSQSYLQTSDTTFTILYTKPRNVVINNGVVLYGDEDYLCGVPDFVKIDFALPDFDVIRVCEYTPNLQGEPEGGQPLRLIGEGLIAFNAGPTQFNGNEFLAVFSNVAPVDGDCVDTDSDGICDNVDDSIPGQFCGPGTTWDPATGFCVAQISCGVGTMWDPQTETCIPSNPSDSNQDGCVDVNDILDHLAAFGTGC